MTQKQIDIIELTRGYLGIAFATFMMVLRFK